MISSRSVRPLRAVINCLGKAINRLGISKPRVVIVSDTPSVVKAIEPNISAIAEVSLIYKHRICSNLRNIILQFHSRQTKSVAMVCRFYILTISFSEGISLSVDADYQC